MCAATRESIHGPRKSRFFNVRLDPQMHRELQQLAGAHERTTAGELRHALRLYLDATKQEPTAALSGAEGGRLETKGA